MKACLRAGIRPSRLAFSQLREVESLLPGISFEIKTIVTQGDRDKITPLDEFEGSDFFTHEIEQALLSGAVDIAVHSAKDLGDRLPPELVIAAITKSISAFDCLVSRNGFNLETLAKGSIVGTSSSQRKNNISKYRPDLRVKNIRGNIDERIAQLDRGDYDAIIVAHAALIRLGLERRISEIIRQEIMSVHPLQGSLVVQTRRDRNDLIELFKAINDG